MANDAAKIKYGLEIRSAPSNAALRLKEETKIFSNFRSGAMKLLARVRSRILKVKPTCLSPQVNGSQTMRPLRQANDLTIDPVHICLTKRKWTQTMSGTVVLENVRRVAFDP
jgi:hypothetical protein